MSQELRKLVLLQETGRVYHLFARLTVYVAERISEEKHLPYGVGESAKDVERAAGGQLPVAVMMMCGELPTPRAIAEAHLQAARLHATLDMVLGDDREGAFHDAGLTGSRMANLAAGALADAGYTPELVSVMTEAEILDVNRIGTKSLEVILAWRKSYHPLEKKDTEPAPEEETSGVVPLSLIYKETGMTGSDDHTRTANALGRANIDPGMLCIMADISDDLILAIDKIGPKSLPIIHAWRAANEETDFDAVRKRLAPRWRELVEQV